MNIFDTGNEELKPFYTLEEFPKFKWLVSQYPIILNELNKNTFWMKWGSDSADPSGHCMFLSGDWTVCPVYFGKYEPQMMRVPGVKPDDLEKMVQYLPQLFPNITELLKNIDNINFSAFSRLHSKSTLAPHKHTNPESLIFHLGLIIPPENSCGLKVADKTHTWSKPGDAVIFNDNFQHSAWNHSEQERIILYVDFKR
ncbi:MAG: aspartyl/asparaginyl beta-hydroxylase domain-containing protein [Candidatus Protochlamydia sp.]|nr:aspartyl/asparaginyl beta-hydroxylase domain-containing protein [Candidatus Protochlamydia sp.]